MPIKIATAEDLPRVFEIGRASYKNRDVGLAQRYLEDALNRSDRLFLVGNETAGIASVTDIYGFERKARLDILAGYGTKTAPLEAFRMVKIMLDWATKAGAKSFRLEADTGVDFAPFARRLGGALVNNPCYDIPLTEKSDG